jgi:hypothetical protein
LLGVGGVIEGLTLNGFSDWRLPHRTEIDSIIDSVGGNNGCVLQGVASPSIITSTTYGGDATSIFRKAGLIITQGLKTTTTYNATLVRTFYT